MAHTHLRTHVDRYLVNRGSTLEIFLLDGHDRGLSYQQLSVALGLATEGVFAGIPRQTLERWTKAFKKTEARNDKGV